jgi:hypothetical protein
MSEPQNIFNAPPWYRLNMADLGLVLLELGGNKEAIGQMLLETYQALVKGTGGVTALADRCLADLEVQREAERVRNERTRIERRRLAVAAGNRGLSAVTDARTDVRTDGSDGSDGSDERKEKDDSLSSGRKRGSKGKKDSSSPKKPNVNDPIWKEVATLFHFKPPHLTAVITRINAVVRDLKILGATPELIREKFNRANGSWDKGFSPEALLKHWHQLVDVGERYGF